MKDYSQIIDFISNDTKANANSQPLRVLLPSVIFLIIFIPVLSSSLKETNSGFDLSLAWPYYSVGALILASLVAFGQSLFTEKPNWKFISLLSATLIAALTVPSLSEAFIAIPHSEAFWHDALACFIFGAAVSAVTSAGLIIVTRFKGPVPTRTTRFALTAMGSLTGLCALFYHCPNADFGHLLAGHGGQFAVMFGITLAINEIIFLRVVKKQLGSAAHVFKNLASFDKN